MPDIDYLKIFRDAGKIVWKKRFLLWFGLFLALPGMLNFRFSPSDDPRTKETWDRLAANIHPQQFLAAHTGLVIILAVIAFFAFLSFLVLGFISQGALIKSTQMILKSKPSGFRLGFAAGRRYFWKIISILFFSGILLFFCLVILIAPIVFLFTAKSYVIGTLLALCAIAILIPLIVIYIYLRRYACLYAVLADINVWLAMENAYALFRRNVWPSIIMSLLFIPLGILAFLTMLLFALVFLVIFGLFGFVLYLVIKQAGIIIAAVIGGSAFLLTVLTFYSAFNAFSEVAWVLFFHIIAAPQKTQEVTEKVSEAENESASLTTTDAVKTAQTEEEL